MWDYGSGEVKGRQATKQVIARMPKPKERAGAARHNISSDVIRVEGDRFYFLAAAPWPAVTRSICSARKSTTRSNGSNPKACPIGARRLELAFTS